jgi:hypothetical protein
MAEIGLVSAFATPSFETPLSTSASQPAAHCASVAAVPATF